MRVCGLRVHVRTRACTRRTTCYMPRATCCACVPVHVEREPAGEVRTSRAARSAGHCVRAPRVPGRRRAGLIFGRMWPHRGWVSVRFSISIRETGIHNSALTPHGLSVPLGPDFVPGLAAAGMYVTGIPVVASAVIYQSLDITKSCSIF